MGRSKPSKIASWTRRSKNSVFGKQYMNYWENRKDQALETNINNDARTTVFSIQQLINQNIREKAKNAFCRSSSPGSQSSNLEFPDPTSFGSDSPGSESLDPSSFGSASSSSSTSDIPINENIAKALVQASNLASDLVGHLNIIDLSSDSVVETLKEYITEEEYMNIISSLKTEEVELSKNANELIKAIKSIKSFSCRTLRNTLYKHG
ncbi:hypothetical protein [Parasitella parasitica]|uniref:Uncharacterized protein n=1 Tax=Parasitella parasitica TaxID=35722 RepID=A0A0B7NBZ8_9FUNG|nr:hypothetical protein [Parasitella parasitica]